MKIEIFKPEDIKKNVQIQIESVWDECFSDVPESESIENFYADPYAVLAAIDSQKVIGAINIFKRKITFAGKKISLGGIGAVCVITEERRKGIGTLMVGMAMKHLKAQNCDIACLNVDLKKKIYGLYEKLGFVMMDREITFENVYGKIIKE